MARTTKRALINARLMRREHTEAERRLWAALRSRRLAAFKFRRQHPIGHFIVDFACIGHRLVIELDGGQHAIQTAKDAARTDVIEALGYRVLRFWNNDVLSNTEGVLTKILEALGE